MRRLTPLTYALSFTAFDALWAWQAMSAVPRYQGSTVSLASFAFWAIVHLPAGFVGGVILRPLGLLPPTGVDLPAWCLAFLAGLGLLQTFFVTWWIARWSQRKAKA